MIALSVIGVCWAVGQFPHMQFSAWGQCLEIVFGVAIVVIVGLTAILQRPFLFSKTRGEGALNLDQVGALFLQSWRRIWTEKWIMWLFGSVAIVRAVGTISQSVLEERYLSSAVSHLPDWLNRSVNGWPLGEGFKHGGILFGLQLLQSSLASNFSHQLSSILSQFYPSIGLGLRGVTAIIVAAAVVLSTPWVWRGLKRLDVGPEFAGSLHFVRALFFPAVIVSAAILFVEPKYLMYQFLSSARLLSHERGAFASMERALYSTASSILLMLLGLITGPALMGGLSGSLRAAEKGVSITAGRFFSQSAAFFKPMAGLFVLALVAELVLSLPNLLLMVRAPHGFVGVSNYFYVYPVMWSLLSFALMFVPYTIVARGTGVIDSIRRGVRDLLGAGPSVMMFAAVGITVVATTGIAQSLLREIIPQFSVFQYVRSIIYIGVSVLLDAVTAIAVWEFYSRITGQTVNNLPTKEPVGEQ
jgi:hypothetical protein